MTEDFERVNCKLTIPAEFSREQCRCSHYLESQTHVEELFRANKSYMYTNVASHQQRILCFFFDEHELKKCDD